MEKHEKIFDFQKLINEAIYPRNYFDMIELEDKVRCEHFAGNEKTINTIHENLINVFELADKYDESLIEDIEYEKNKN